MIAGGARVLLTLALPHSQGKKKKIKDTGGAAASCCWNCARPVCSALAALSALTWLSRGLIKDPEKVQSSSCLGASLNPRGNLRFAERAHRNCGPLFHKSN